MANSNRHATLRRRWRRVSKKKGCGNNSGRARETGIRCGGKLTKWRRDLQADGCRETAGRAQETRKALRPAPPTRRKNGGCGKHCASKRWSGGAGRFAVRRWRRPTGNPMDAERRRPARSKGFKGVVRRTQRAGTAPRRHWSVCERRLKKRPPGLTPRPRRRSRRRQPDYKQRVR